MAESVTVDQARRIAVRAQLLDGSASDVLETVRHLGFLQLDPIAVVAPPQHLVLWSRLGPFDTRELDRLLWDERRLFEWNAFVYPVEHLPVLRAQMLRWRRGATPQARRANDWLERNAPFRRYVLRELRRRGRRVPVLIVSSEDQAGLVGQAPGAGASSFLRKPVAGQLLLRAIRRLTCVADGQALG